MADYDYLVSENEKALLGTLCGRKLKDIEGYRFDLVRKEDKTTFYTMARLNLEDGSRYDLRLHFVRVDITESFWDDVGAFSFSEAKGDIWLPEGVKTFRLPINGMIGEVALVNDYDTLMHGAERAATFAFTKAVLLRTGLEYVAFAMDDFCEDAIVVRRGFDPDELVPDGSGSWYENPGWTDEYSRKLERL